MDIEHILIDLISIRSDKRRTTNGNLVVEQDVVTYLQHLLAEQFPWIHVEVQPLENGRTNLFVHDGSPVDILFMAHMDTVEEGAGWTKNVRGEISGDKLYGRGSADMKAGLVAILDALLHAHETGKPGIAALFYCDEEYDFLGMRAFLAEYGDRISPKLIICPEPTQEQIRPGCRGIIEWKVAVEGTRGHSARPQSGASAFLAFQAGMTAMQEMLSRVTDPFLGKPTMNIAAARCGSILKKSEDGTVELSQAANVIPDYCEAVVEVRSVPGISSTALLNVFQSAVASSGGRVTFANLVHDIGSFATPKEQLSELEQVQKDVLGSVTYEDPTKGGYSDAQMAAERWGVPTVVLGPKGAGMHGSDEYVERESVKRLCRLFRACIDMR